MHSSYPLPECKSLHCGSPADLSFCRQQRPHRSVMPFAPPYTGVQDVMCLLGRARGCDCSTGAQRLASPEEGPKVVSPITLS